MAIYEDFLCPFCGEFEESSARPLTAGVEAGRVTVDYRPIAFLDASRRLLARAPTRSPSCSTPPAPDVAKFHDLLFANQPDEGGDECPTTTG